MTLRLMLGLTLCFLSPGCGSLPEYRSTALTLHKDALLINVYLPEREDLDTYRQIVQAELQKIQQSPQSSSIPLYEIRFEFRHQTFPQNKLASIIVHANFSVNENLYSKYIGDPKFCETYLY